MTSFVYTHYTIPAVYYWNPASTPSIQTLASNQLYTHDLRICISGWFPSSHKWIFFLNQLRLFNHIPAQEHKFHKRLQPDLRYNNNWFYILLMIHLHLTHQLTCMNVLYSEVYSFGKCISVKDENPSRGSIECLCLFWGMFLLQLQTSFLDLKWPCLRN